MELLRGGSRSPGCDEEAQEAEEDEGSEGQDQRSQTAAEARRLAQVLPILLEGDISGFFLLAHDKIPLLLFLAWLGLDSLLKFFLSLE